MNPAAELAGAQAARKSYERIFVSTFVIGGSSVLNILIGLVRMKAVALMLGPVGIGLIGLLGALMATAATIAEMGFGAVGARQIAQAHASGDARRLAVSRKALLIATLVLCVLGGSTVWLLRLPLATLALGDATTASSVALLALGVSLSVAGAAQVALIQGMQRVRDLGWMTVLGALANTIVGVPLIWELGKAGIAAYLVLGQLVSFSLGLWFVGRLPRAGSASISLADLRPHWVMFLRLGVPFMGANIAATLVELLIRMDVRQQLGSEALGQFQASWTIAAQYVGFVLGAMAADYYPRLSKSIDDDAKACRLINEQTEAALLLSGVAIIIILALAPSVIALIYTARFAPAAAVLRWQAAGDVLRVTAWPLGFAIVAAGAGRTFFLTEISARVLMVGVIHCLLPQIGVVAGGVGYFVSCAFYLPLVFLLNARRIGFRWSFEAGSAIALLSTLCIAIVGAIWLVPERTVAFGALALAIYGVFAFQRLRRMGIASAIVARLSGRRVSNRTRPEKSKATVENRRRSFGERA